VHIHRDATIVSAHLHAVPVDIPTNFDDVTPIIYGADEGDYPAPTTYAELYDDYVTRTTAYTSWPISGTSLGVSIESPDIAAVIQEIVSRADWYYGNALGLIIYANGASSHHVGFAAYENTTYSPFALHVVFTDPDPPNAPTLTAPNGGETWREGESKNLTYTPASPEHPAGLPCTYEYEFSADGSFADAVLVESDISASPHAWTLPQTLVTVDTATCKMRVRARVTDDLTSAWDASSGAFTVLQSTAPAVTLVTPLDTALLPGLTPAFIFGTADTESDPVHAEFIVSPFADYSAPVINTDSTTDYANWEESVSPFTTWTTVGSGGATAGNRIRYTGPNPFRYDNYYGKVRLKDAYSTAAFTEFTFVISVDAAIALSVTIGGTAFNVTACTIIENTGGEASPIDLAIPLSAFLAHPLTAGDEIAISSGLGDHNRSWNGTLESWKFAGTVVDIHGLQDDAYLSRKLATGNEATADIGQNLADFITSYGAPLTGINIDVVTGLSAPLTGGYKYLREHFADAAKALPNYILWVDSGGDIHWVDTADLTGPTYVLFEPYPG
jgi:hypothetical protein